MGVLCEKMTFSVNLVNSFDQFELMSPDKKIDGQSVEKAKSTTFEHNYIKQLATYRGQPLTTGSQKPNHAKTEIMSLETGE